ncbi:MAG: hypothetical protein J5716_05095 [Alphaproteobacteria bacterium]|nr:hypothetical protein [Alphaproteobacteria bacterium]
MTSFRNKLLAAFLCFGVIGNATAQDKIYLVPPVQLLPLKKMETNAYGIIVPVKTDILNENVWKNAAYPVTTAKFSQIGNQLPAKAEELRLTLLKLTADPPQGTAGQSFITLKLQTLFDRGQFEDAHRLLQKIPEKTRTDVQNKIHADLLLTNDLQAACFLTQKESDDSFWQNLSAVCAAFNQEEDKAFLALELLKEQGLLIPFISHAVDHFLYHKPLKTKPDEITPLTAAIWRSSKKSLLDLKDPDGKIWYKTMIVRDETIPVEKRLAIAEELVQLGIIAPSKLRTYYQQVSFKNRKSGTFTAEIQRAQYVQQAAALSSQMTDNLKKQALIKKGLRSAKKARVSYAFSAAIKDILETITPDLDTLAKSADLIEAFALAGLKDQVFDWQKKAEILFPVSETTAYGWYFGELLQPDKNKRFLISSLENMMAYAEKHQTIDTAFISAVDRLMLTFKALDMIPADESWHYTSFPENSDEDEFVNREQPLSLENKPVGDIVLEALRELNGTYIGLLNALEILRSAGLQQEAVLLALQSIDLILPPVQTHE